MNRRFMERWNQGFHSEAVPLDFLIRTVNHEPTGKLGGNGAVTEANGEGGSDHSIANTVCGLWQQHWQPTFVRAPLCRPHTAQLIFNSLQLGSEA